MVVQVDPIKPTLEAPGIERLKLEHEELLSTFAFRFNSRRCTLGGSRVEEEAVGEGEGRNLHSSTFQLKLSRFRH
jgi:hypothetical protein